MRPRENVAMSSSREDKDELDKMRTEDLRKPDFKISVKIGIIPQVSKRRQYQEVLRSMTLGNSKEEKRGADILKEIREMAQSSLN